MTDERHRTGLEPPMVALGLILIVGGGALLVAQLMDVDFGRIGWPFFVIAPGVVLLLAGLASSGGLGLAIAGSIVTMVGLILFFQNATGLYATWAYAWALTGQRYPATRASQAGLVHQVAALGQLDALLAEVLEGLTQTSVEALRGTKSLVRDLSTMPLEKRRVSGVAAAVNHFCR